jgi:hypothetical protein
MRQRLLLTLLVASTAAADPKPPAPKGKGKTDVIDVAPVLDKLLVYKDELGKYFVAPRPGGLGDHDTSQWVFYGDQKGLYQQRIIGMGVSGGKADRSEERRVGKECKA